MIPHTLEKLTQLPTTHWIVVGKGPSFCPALVKDFFQRGYQVCSINNAAAGLDVPVALVVANDWKPLDLFGPIDTILASPSALHPNLPRSIPDMLQACSAYAKWSAQITCFDLDVIGHPPGHPYYPDYPTIEACFSSTESAVQLLAHAGVREIHFNGVDGGQPHHPFFEARQEAIPLDGQFTFLKRLFFKWPDLRFSGLPAETGLNA